jgi:hypothetical protein
LAYALTIHKAQGSEFGLVIVALPRGRMAFRELIYTALTRSRRRLVLLVQGTDLSDLLELRRPEASEAIRRNTNLFRASVRESSDRPYAHHLVHRAPDGTLLRSKSELIIYTRCLEAGLRPMYEQRYEGSDGRWKLPDFTFSDSAGEPVIWEHLGMLDDPGYRSSWERKLAWYEGESLVLDENLFWTEERRGIDVSEIDQVLARVAERIS